MIQWWGCNISVLDMYNSWWILLCYMLPSLQFAVSLLCSVLVVLWWCRPVMLQLLLHLWHKWNDTLAQCTHDFPWQERSSENTEKHQNSWQLGPSPIPHWGSLQHCPGPLAGAPPQNPTPALSPYLASALWALQLRAHNLLLNQGLSEPFCATGSLYNYVTMIWITNQKQQNHFGAELRCLKKHVKHTVWVNYWFVMFFLTIVLMILCC